MNPDRKRKFEDDATAVDATLKLTTLEQRWARQLGSATRDCKGLSPLTEWDISRRAVVSLGEGVEDTVVGIRQMQAFLSKFGIHSNLADGLAVLSKFAEKFPDVLLKIDTCADSKDGSRYFAVIDLAALIQCVASCMEAQSKDVNDEDWKTLLASIFYLSQCLCPQMEGLRRGCTLIVECSNVDWSTPKSAECLAKLWLNVSSGCFPVLCQDVWFYNATQEGASALTVLGIANFRQELMDRMYIGCQMAVNGQPVSLRDLFSSRTADEKQQGTTRRHPSLLPEVERLLKLSFGNEGRFSLR